MKRIILALVAAMTLCSLVQASNRTVTENDSLGNKKRVIELHPHFAETVMLLLQQSG